MPILLRIFETLGRVGYYLSASLIVLIVTSVMTEVVLRAVTGTSIAWVTEVSGYILAGVIFLGLGYVYRHDGHVRMSLLLDYLSPNKSRILYWITDLIVLTYAAIQLWKFFELAWESYQFNWRSSTILEIPLVFPQILMVTGAFVFVTEIISTALSRKCIDLNSVRGEQE